MGCLESRGNLEKRIRILGLEEVKEYRCNPYFFGISPNEKHLAHFFYNKINIVNLKTSKKINEFQVKQSPIFFSYLDYFENSKMMCCAIYSSRIQIYRADNHYKLINTIYGWNSRITGLKIINKNQILILHNYLIVVIDYVKKCEILKIIVIYQRDEKRSLEFDSQNQVIIFHQGDSINFYKMNGERAIYFYDHNIYDRILIIKNTNQIISVCNQSLVLWQIDYKQKKLIKLREFLNQSPIYGAQLFLQSLLIIVDNDNKIILDLNDFRIIYGERQQSNYDRRKHSKFQLNDRKTQITTTSNHYIFIRCFGYLKIFKTAIMM